MALTYTLIGAPFSAATVKARLCLRWSNLPMTEKPATMRVVQTYIKPRLKTVATPLIICSDQSAFTDTRLLLDGLGGDHPAQTLFPDTPAQRFASASPAICWRRGQIHSFAGTRSMSSGSVSVNRPRRI